MSNEYQTVVVNLDEVWLKGLNRNFYLQILKKNVSRVVKALHPEKYEIKLEGPKQIINSEIGFSDMLITRITKIPGVSSVSLVRKVACNADDIFPEVEKEINSYPQVPKTFKLSCKRANKHFHLNSMQLSKEVGSQVSKKFPQMKAQMKNPEMEIKLRVTNKNIFISSRNVRGTGGLPVGTSGHMICLLSGGFDSPVAAYMMSRRGVDLNFVFFHAYPFVGHEVKDKIIELSKELSQYQRHSPLYVIPFGKIQEKIAKNSPYSYRTVLFRKYMVDCANRLANKIGAKGLVTGDALSQVSSQTLENLSVIDKYSELPIFRPLIGFNKNEIIAMSRKVGTHDISIRPHDDACDLFSSRHPIIKASKRLMDKFCSELKLDDDLEQSLYDSEVYYFNRKGRVIRATGKEDLKQYEKPPLKIQ